MLTRTAAARCLAAAGCCALTRTVAATWHVSRPCARCAAAWRLPPSVPSRLLGTAQREAAASLYSLPASRGPRVAGYLQPLSLARVSLPGSCGPARWRHPLAHSLSRARRCPVLLDRCSGAIPPTYTHLLTDGIQTKRSLMRAAGGPRLMERRRGPSRLKNRPGPQAMRARNETEVMLETFYSILFYSGFSPR